MLYGLEVWVAGLALAVTGSSGGIRVGKMWLVLGEETGSHLAAVSLFPCAVYNFAKAFWRT